MYSSRVATESTKTSEKITIRDFFIPLLICITAADLARNTFSMYRIFATIMQDLNHDTSISFQSKTFGSGNLSSIRNCHGFQNRNMEGHITET